MSEAQDKERVLRPRKGFEAINFRELWRFRELFWMLAWRNILIRYKQTYIGVAWAVLQPLLIIVVFTVIFGKLAKLPDGGAKYPILTMAAVLPWQFFANALSESSNSLVAAQNIITKVYFPRLLIPLSSVLSGSVDFAISIGILFVMMLMYDVPFTSHMLLLPLLFLLTFVTALAAGLWLSALNVKYRDVKYVVPFIVRLGLYVTPVGFLTTALVPELLSAEDLVWYYGANPMVGIVDGFRWCILGADFAPHWIGFFISVLVTGILLISGAFYFRATERTFADTI